MSANSTSGVAESEGARTDRRWWLGASASLTMAAGLAGGYGTFAAMAGQYLFSTHDDRAWLFVGRARDLAPGAALEFESPTGVRVTVARRAESDAAAEPTDADFSAMSSVCPHLGCRVHWEPQNRRYFCPCHNGVFDVEGRATSGPPAAAGQSLPRYPLRVDQGLVFIEMPLNAIGLSRPVFVGARRRNAGGASERASDLV